MIRPRGLRKLIFHVADSSFTSCDTTDRAHILLFLTIRHSEASLSGCRRAHCANTMSSADHKVVVTIDVVRLETKTLKRRLARFRALRELFPRGRRAAIESSRCGGSGIKDRSAGLVPTAYKRRVAGVWSAVTGSRASEEADGSAQKLRTGLRQSATRPIKAKWPTPRT